MSIKTNYKPSVARYGDELEQIFSKTRMVVFLCGPALVAATAGAILRGLLKTKLEDANFEVVLGEDDGLEELRKRYANIYAHLNELTFIEKECGAIVLIADSVGSYCELGLFAYLQSQRPAKSRDFILVIDKKYENAPSYLNEGPAKAVHDFGKVFYGDLNNFDPTELIDRLKRRRAAFLLDSRGKPRGRRSAKQ